MRNFERTLRRALPSGRKLHDLWKMAVSPLLKVDPRVIVLGNQKSGTSAIASLLAAHTGLSATLDLRGLARDLELGLHEGRIDFGEFVRLNRYEFARELIKEPSLTLLYPMVKRFFPRAQYLVIVRDPRENIRSILNRLGIRGDLRDIEAGTVEALEPADWQLVVDGRWLGLQGTYIDMLAARWNRMIDMYIDHPGALTLIRYEDFLADKPGSIEALARQLGLPSVTSIADRVDVQYNRRGKDRDMPWEQFFGPENLQRIETICASRMETFGYPPGRISARAGRA